MGVADKLTYRDMYHFNPNFFNKASLEELPSLNVDPKINTTIKDNPYRTNVEIEKDEIVLQPDMSALFKARGKTHKNGGINVNLRPESFVFSNDKSMNISDKEHKLFELKEGGKTPAEVLKKNVDVKHYNRMIANISDINKDDLAKKSSAMMLEKYIGTLGNIAYIQENKKNFPDGIPPFSMGTAPVYNTELKDEIMQQKQYAKYGGNIKAQWGLYNGMKAKNAQTQLETPDVETPFEFNNKWYIRKNGNMIEVQKPTRQPFGSGYLLDPTTKYRNTPNEVPVPVQQNQPTVPAPTQAPTQAPTPGSDDNTNGLSGIKPLSGIPPEKQKTYGFIGPPDPGWNKTTPKIENTPGPVPGEVTGEAGKPISADWQFTPWQKVSHAWNAAKYASLRRYDTMRSRYDPSYVDPTLLNPEQMIGDLKGVAGQQIRALGTLNPILRNAQAANTQGQLLNQLPGVRSAIENQNVGISNQFKQYNNQIANTTEGQNMQNDAKYYEQSIVGRQNFDNMKSYLGDQWMNNVLGDVTTNQTLAWNLLTQNNPRYGYDFRTGKAFANAKDLRDVTSNGKNDILSEYTDKMLKDWDNLDAKTKVELMKVMVAKGFTPTAKKGKYLRPKY